MTFLNSICCLLTLVPAIALASDLSARSDLGKPELAAGDGIRAAAPAAPGSNQGNKISATQRGDGNQAVLTLQGKRNEIALTQTGIGNQALVTAAGNNSRIAVGQNGNANAVDIQLNGSNRNIQIQQTGNNRSDKVILH